MKFEGIQLLVLFLAIYISVGDARAPKKIVNGWTANDAEFPYQVSLQRDGFHYCGGSIIYQKWILTAAHCVNFQEGGILSPHRIKVVTGVNDLAIPWNSRFYNVFDVAYVIPHQQFDPRQPPGTGLFGFADIALLKLTQSIPVDHYRVPISLPQPSDYIFPGEEAIVSGWGHSFHGAELPVRFLQKLPMIISDWEKCRAAHGPTINAGNMCAENNVGVSGTCQGDSGGPLVSGNKIIGLVSFGIKCGESLDVFTNVQHYLQWISSVIQHYGLDN